MIYTAIDNFYLTEEELRDSPSRKDGVDEDTETSLRTYGCDLIQESGILLKLPQAVMATGQVLFHRFYCKKSFARFSVKRVAASCVWLASKLEESPRRSKSVILVFHRMECRRENLPIHHLDIHSKKFSDLKNDLIRMERHLLKEMGFICHVEHPHKFISNYLMTLESPELTQEAWNLANDSLRTTLCVRFKSEVVACGVVYAAARRSGVPLPEDPAWCTAFDADEESVAEVCRVLARLYTAPQARYIAVYKDDDSFSVVGKDSRKAIQESPATASTEDSSTPNLNQAILSHESSERLNETKKSDDESTIKRERLSETKKNDDETTIKRVSTEPETKNEMDVPSERIEGEKVRQKSRDREREREREKDSSRGRDRNSDREREREREKERERRHYHYQKKDKSSGHLEHSRRHASQDRGDYYRDKDRHRRNPY